MPFIGGSQLLANNQDIDFTTEGAGKVLAAVPSNGRAFSFVTASGGSSATALTYDQKTMRDVSLANYWPLSSMRDAVGTIDFSQNATVARVASLMPNGDTAIALSSGGYLQGNAAILQAAGSSFSYEFLINLTALPTALAGIFSPAYTSGLGVEVDTTGLLHILFAYIADETTTVTLTVGTTYFVLVTYDGTTVRIYLNGSTTPAWSYASGLSGRPADGAVQIGTRNSIAATPCTIAKFAYYLRCLSGSDSAAHYANTQASP